jgi:hypothetical protein
MASVDELVNYRAVITVKAAHQDDRQAIEPTDEVRLEAGVHGHHSRQAGMRRCSDTDRVGAPVWSLAIMWWCHSLRPADRPPR